MAIEYDFSVKFNADVSGRTNYDSESIDSNDKATELLCDLQRTQDTNMFSDLDFTENSTRRLQGNKPPRDGNG